MRMHILIALAVLLSSCDKDGESRPAIAGNADNGSVLVSSYSCGACHEIPGVRNARGKVGPPLRGVADRAVLAGYLPNTPENMRAWIENPQKLLPGNAMPNMEISEDEARDIAAYLYTLD